MVVVVVVRAGRVGGGGEEGEGGGEGEGRETAASLEQWYASCNILSEDTLDP